MSDTPTSDATTVNSPGLHTPIRRGFPFIRLGLVIFISVFLASIASCAAIYMFFVKSTGDAVSQWRRERDTVVMPLPQPPPPASSPYLLDTRPPASTAPVQETPPQ